MRRRTDDGVVRDGFVKSMLRQPLANVGSSTGAAALLVGMRKSPWHRLTVRYTMFRLALPPTCDSVKLKTPSAGFGYWPGSRGATNCSDTYFGIGVTRRPWSLPVLGKSAMKWKRKFTDGRSVNES